MPTSYFGFREYHQFMNEEQKTRVRELTAELDSLVPTTNAVVEMRQYGGGCDESELIATETGYLRLGIELLKAPFLPPLPDAEAVQIAVDIEYLTVERSDVGFQRFRLDDTLQPDAAYVPKARQVWKDRIGAAVAGSGCLLLVYVFGVGVVTVLQWIFK